MDNNSKILKYKKNTNFKDQIGGFIDMLAVAVVGTAYHGTKYTLQALPVATGVVIGAAGYLAALPFLGAHEIYKSATAPPSKEQLRKKHYDSCNIALNKYDKCACSTHDPKKQDNRIFCFNSLKPEFEPCKHDIEILEKARIIIEKSQDDLCKIK
jgi:hypothetical protein